MRKDDHIKYALMQNNFKNDFHKVRFVPCALNNISFDEVSLATKICGIKFKHPIYINAMTGGGTLSREVNDKLSKLAKFFDLPIASGSLSIALKKPEVVDSFTIIRKNNPVGIVMANIGVDKTYQDAKKAVDILDADILQIHLNTVQEMIMPEGNRDFTMLEENIRSIVSEVDVPVMIKEVGFGMSHNSIEKIKSLGINTIDISGTGGTNFAIIENQRRKVGFNTLNSFGLTTVESLLEATQITNIDILASGGVTTPMDVVISLALGAKAVGMASYFLHLVTNYSFEQQVEKFTHFLLELKTIMTVLGARNVKDLKKMELIFNHDLINFLNQRQIDLKILKERL